MSDSVQNQTFQFTLSNGQVTAEQVVRGGHTSNVPIPSGATFAVGAGTITETLSGAHESKTILFTADAATPANYQVSSITETVTSPTTVDGKGHVHGTSFTIIDGKVTAEQEVSGSSATSTHSHAVRLDPAAQFTVNGSTVTETTVEGNRIETTQFVSSGSAGLYAVSSETTTFVPAGTATTHLSVDTSDRLEFTFGPAGSVATASRAHADIITATMLRFVGEALTGVFDLEAWPALAAHAARCEALPVFQEISQPYRLVKPGGD
jgi:hypothetical protein